MKNEINRALVAKKKLIVTFILVALLPISLMAQGSITEPGATDPNQLYTTTYDNPGGPNHAPGGPHKISGDANQSEENPGTQSNEFPIGAPWALLAFAAAYGAFRLIRRRGVEE